MHTITSERIKLIEISEDDTKFIVDLRNKYYFYNKKAIKITFDEHILWYKKHYLNDNNRIDFIVFDNKQNKMGVVGIKKIDKNVEVSYIFDEKYRKKGYASEALTLVMDYARTIWEFKKFIAQIKKRNNDSVKFIMRNGFSFVNNNEEMLIFSK